MTDNEINRLKAKIAVLSVENANLKICVGGLNAELENKNVELVGMRGACESYKMHYDNAQAEVERLKTRNDELNALNKTASIEAIREFAERLKEKLQWDVEFDNKLVFESDIDNLVKEMTE